MLTTRATHCLEAAKKELDEKHEMAFYGHHLLAIIYGLDDLTTTLHATNVLLRQIDESMRPAIEGYRLVFVPPDKPCDRDSR